MSNGSGMHSSMVSHKNQIMPNDVIGEQDDVEEEDVDEWMELLVYRHTYWSNTARSQTEQKKSFHIRF